MQQVIPGTAGVAPRPPDELSDADAAAVCDVNPGTRCGTLSDQVLIQEHRGRAITRHHGIVPATPRGREEDPQPIRRRTRVKCWHADSLASLPEIVRGELNRSLTPDQAFSILHDWSFWARPNQLPPAGEWRFGCCSLGADLEDADRRRIGAAARRAGRHAGLPLSRRQQPMCVTSWSRAKAASWRFARPGRPRYEPSKRRLTWPNGAIATLFSADEPERLRGPQHDLAWCDELAAWRYPEAWDMLMFGLRLGEDPRAVVTTTPRPTPLIRMCWPTRRLS